MSSVASPPLQLDTAYGICRHVARSSAKNFYYGFMLLPRRKRDALSAVYAFMRHADDICDAPGMGIAERREKLSAWLESYHRVAAGEPTDDPVFMALRDSQQQFGIPLVLLDQLVHGTGMDLQDAPENETAGAGGTPQPVVAYSTFADLYQYCYHVASVVGLVCIRIFGYSDAAAEPLAERVGIAFQLTNILRDIREDAEMGRIYIPEEDLRRFGVTPAELASGANPERLLPLLRMQAQRAREYYSAAGNLLPLIEHDAQSAFAVLVEIYFRLLQRIEESKYDVFSRRVRLSTWEKLGVLCQGWMRRFT
jgi:phytoene synthase